MKQFVLKRAGLRTLYKKELKKDFPPTELKPLRAMMKLYAARNYEPLIFYDEEGLAGYALLWTTGDVALLDYFGVPEARRNQGLGSRILKDLRKHLHGRVMLLEAEAPDGGEEDGLRQRRIAFYERCGCQLLPYDCGLFGVHYRCMALNWNGKNPQKLMEKHHRLYERDIPKRLFEGNVRIPLLPGEKAPATVTWNKA